MFELSEEIRTTRARRDDHAVDPQYLHGVADAIVEIGLTGRRTGRRHALPKLNVICKNHPVGEHESESAAGSIRSDAKNTVRVLTQKGHPDYVLLRINCQFDKPQSGVGQRVTDFPGYPATLRG